MPTDDKPLEGRRVVVTRAAEQSAELTARLEALGAQVLLLPLIEFAPPDDFEPLDRAFAELDRFDWLFLTSQNTVRFLAARARSISYDLAAKLAEQNKCPRVAAVGSSTAEAAREQGWRVDRVSGGRGGRELVRELASELRGLRVLVPRSDRARGDLLRALAETGSTPVEIVVYKTVSAPRIDSAILERIERGEVDAMSFASPSAFSAFVESVGMETLKRLIASVRIAAIGPTTAAAIRGQGMSVTIEASIPTSAGLAAAIAAHFARISIHSGGTQ